MIQQTMVMDADEYNALSAEVKACRANMRVAFRAGAEAAREADCRVVCEFCADGERAEYYAGEDLHPGGWTHNRLSGRTWCKASSIRALPLPERADAVPHERPER